MNADDALVARLDELIRRGDEVVRQVDELAGELMSALLKPEMEESSV